MEVKKMLLIICILLCFILTISSINAVENDINVITSNNNDSEVILTNVEEVDVLSDNDDGSFASLNEKISKASENDVIELTHDYIWSDKDNLNNGTVIDKTITINGNNHIIDAKSHDRIFRITASNVILKNIIFINGKATKENIGQGGAIWWEGTYGTVENCTFKDNTVVSDTYNRGSAGAIFWEGSYGTIIDSKFINNNGDGHNEAGAVYWDSIHGNIQNTQFINNSHTNLGGALYIGENGDYTNITDCTFINNTAGRYGAAVALHHKDYVKISNVEFINNTAEYAGGSIYYNYPVEGNNEFDVINCTFIGNIANGNAQLSGPHGGGAIYASKYGNIVHSSFIDNKAPYDSNGAISWWEGSVNITESLFINNTASSGKYSTFDLNDGKVEDCIILTNTNEKAVLITADVNADYNWWGNTADNYNVKSSKIDGMINKWYYLDVLSYNLDGYAYVTLYNVYDSQNKEKYDVEGYCYLPDISFDVYSKNMTIDVDKVTLVKGEDYYYFDDITYPATITVKNGNVEYTKTITLGDFDLLQLLINEASSGDVVVLTRDYTYSEWLDVGNVLINKSIVIDGNGHTINACGNSRIFKITNGASDLTFKNINFVNGYAYYGGAILIDRVSTINTLKIDNCTFKNNTAYTSDSGYGGGAIYVYLKGNLNTDITNCNFIDNKAHYGGAIYYWVFYTTSNHEFNIYNSSFESDPANMVCSAYIVSDDNIKTKIDNSLFIDSVIESNKGGVINNSIILNNADMDNFLYVGSDFIVDNTWFGSTAENYTVNLTNLINSATINNWLFLNATINPYPALQGTDISVKYTLQSYNPLTGEISDFDNSNLHKVPLLFQAIRGGYTDQQYEVLLNEEFIFHTSEYYYGDAFIEVMYHGNLYKFNFIIKKSSTIEITNDTYELIAGDPHPLILNDLATLSRPGDLKYEINDTSVGFIEGGKLKTLKSGIIKLTVSADANGEYDSANATIIIIVKKNKPTILYNKTDSVDADSSKQLNYRLYQLSGYASYDYDLTFESNDTSILTVDENGVITGIRGGTAKIIIRYEGDEKYESDERSVTVTVNKIPNKLKYNQSIVLDVGQSAILDISQDFSTTLTFNSQNESIVSVDNNGKITAVKGGVTKITINAEENDKYLPNSTTVTVTVKKIHSELNNDEIELLVDEIYNISDLTDISGLTFSSNNTNVASVDNNGLITAIGGGIANITLHFDGNSTHDEFDAYIIVIVNKLPSTITISKEDYTVMVNKNITISPKLSHEGELTYEVDDSSIVSIDNGLIIGAGKGTAIITIRYVGNDRYQGATKEITVKVNRISSEINVNDTFNLKPGETINLNATLNSDASLTYESSNDSIVTVDEYGNVTSLKEGEVNITVKFAGNSKYTDTKKVVKVIVKKLSAEINAGDINLLINETKPIDATLSPVNDKLVYIIGNDSIISISKDGLITPLTSGKTNVTIIFEGNDEYSALNKTIFVNVKKIDAEIRSPNNITLKIGETYDLSQYVDVDEVNITYHKNDGSNLINITDGIVKAISGKTPGFANIMIMVQGNEKYNTVSKAIRINIEKLPFIFNIEKDTTIELEVDEEINLKEKFNFNFNVTSSAFDTPVLNTDGNIIKGLSVGSTYVNIIFEGNDTHKKSNTVLNVNVKRISSIIDVNKNIEINLNDTKNLNAILNHEGTLNYASNNTNIITVDEDGNIKAVSNGIASVKVTFKGNEKYTDASVNVIVTVNKFSIPNTDSAIDFTNSKDTNSQTYSVNLPDDATGTLTVLVDGKEAGKADIINGKASVTVNNINPGEHKVSVIYSGDNKYDGLSKSTTIYVPEIKITKNTNIKMLYTSNTKYTVQLTKDSQALTGVYVTFNVNGKKINVKTNNKGFASVKINLPPKSKSYTVTAEYEGIKVKNTIKVNSIVKAKNIKAKKNKVLKIKVSLKKVNKKYIKGKILKLKFKGKTFKVKTNKKGVATFKIKKNILKKLKVGKKYKYSVTYLKNTVTKKITIK